MNMKKMLTTEIRNACNSQTNNLTKQRQLRNVQNCLTHTIIYSSSHEVAPNLHDTSGENGDPETRESVMKKSRVDADMEINAIESKQDVALPAGRNST